MASGATTATGGTVRRGAAGMAERKREERGRGGEGSAGGEGENRRKGQDEVTNRKRMRSKEKDNHPEVLEFEDTNSQPLTKSQRKELKRQQNLEWKWRRGDADPNPRHTEYYRLQLPELHNEWSQFQETMAKDLPVTFRLCFERNEAVCSALKSRLLSEFRVMRGRFTTVNDSIVEEVVTPISWCCNAWQINCDSATLAKDEAFSPLYSLLTREVKTCHIVRQELVSMIPALLLDPQSHHDTLDMCAAPGSKTEQLISKICGTAPGSGLIVANDADPKRLATLRKRYENCRYPNLVFTCAKADSLLDILEKKVSFQRVLCDVPCTGDGTFRKSPHLWRLFRPRFAVELHPLQLDIARCGVKLMKESNRQGKNCRLVYSTCSLNPIEDEAVVAALLMEFWDQGINLQLLDPSSILCCDNSTSLLARDLPGIRWRPGVTKWFSDVDVMLAGENDPKERLESRSRLPPLSRSMSCPKSEALLAELKLERCMRIFPQDMNTGGFFIAVLEISSSDVSQGQRDALCLEAQLVDDRFRLDRDRLTGEEKKRSMSTFQELGYNPHTAPINDVKRSNPTKSGREWKEISDAYSYSRLSSSEISSFLEQISCSTPSTTHYSLFLEEETVALLDPKHPPEHSGKKKRTLDIHHVSMLSSSAAKILELHSTARFVVQAGIRIIDLFSNPSVESQSVMLSEFGGGMALKYLGRSLEIGADGLRVILRRELSDLQEGSQTILQLSADDEERIQLIPIGSYALLTTKFPLTSASQCLSGKRRMSKAERKKMKTGNLVMGDILREPPSVAIGNSPVSELSVVVQRVRKEVNGEERLKVHAPQEVIRSYFDCLLFHP